MERESDSFDIVHPLIRELKCESNFVIQTLWLASSIFSKNKKLIIQEMNPLFLGCSLEFSMNRPKFAFQGGGGFFFSSYFFSNSYDGLYHPPTSLHSSSFSFTPSLHFFFFSFLFFSSALRCKGRVALKMLQYQHG